MEHSILVKDLIAILSLLVPDDKLIPNRVRNLAIERDGEFIGYIDLLSDMPHGERLQMNDDIQGDAEA
jgi:hypothetical protein